MLKSMFCCCTWGDRQASWYAPPEIAVVVTALGWIVLDRGTRKVILATIMMTAAIMMTAKMVAIMMTAKMVAIMMTAKMVAIMMTAKMVTIMMTAKKAITMMTAKVHIYHHDD